MPDTQVPVFIVGGGGAGLTASMILSTLDVESLLVNALTHTSVLPKAHMLNQRTMEIFTELGAAQEICRQSTPPENMKAVAWYAGLAGPNDWYGRELGRLDCIVDDALWQPGVWDGSKALYTWGPPPPPSFLAPEDLAALMSGSHDPAAR